MKRWIALITLVLVVSLWIIYSTNERFIANGEGEYWDVQMEYNLSNDYFEEEGSIKYTGDEQLKTVNFKWDYPGLGNGSSTNKPVLNNETVFNVGNNRSGVSANGDLDFYRKAINKITLLIKWETDKGEYKELIQLSTK